MKEILDKVEEFQKAFGLEYSSSPEMGSADLRYLRYRLMKEENEEYLEAKNLEQLADALGDKLYILAGTIITHGLQYIIEDVFREIQRANMAKLGKEGKPIINGKNGIMDYSKPTGKVLKPIGWQPPNIKQFLK